MKFIDIATIKVKAGDGGQGCVSFRREKFVPRGGPDGGNGGKGGDVIIEGDEGKHTLLDVSHRPQYHGGRGEHGKGKDMHGRGGEDLVITVPVGTIVRDVDTEDVLADIVEHGQRVVVAEGGIGGRGNTSFVSSTHRAPRHSEPGRPGESRTITLELKLIADVGIIGLPNAGKSTFISAVSAARPKIADYPFTTLTPNLGVVKNPYGKSYVLADMPGLIEGAHEGAGLGHRFLRHIERTRVLLHFVESTATEEGSMIERYEMIRGELKKYSPELAERDEIIVATKIDAADEGEITSFREYVKKNKLGELFEVSAATRTGTDDLIQTVAKRIDLIDEAHEEAE